MGTGGPPDPPASTPPPAAATGNAALGPSDPPGSSPPPAAATGQAALASPAPDNKNKVLPSAASIQSIGGLVAVVVGVVAITALALSTMAFIGSDKDANTVVPLSTAAFGVISAIVGAYLGIKIGTDQSKTFAEDASQAHARLSAVQPFIPPDKQHEAQAAGEKAAAATRSPHI
jgi:hypothetical protein